jgi:hypothetical protein
MNPPARPLTRPKQRGSALLTVMLFTFVLLLLSASVMQWSLSERQLNSRSAYWLEARNAAEAVAEYGCYQVANAFNVKMNPTFGPTGTNPISFPSSIATTLFTGSHVDTSSIELKAGTVSQVPTTGLYYIDPNDINNRFDPMVGRYCYRRDVTILSKATVRPVSGPPITAYIEEKVSVRGAPLFAYAIFYSANDLEFHPAPQMDIYGPTHVNGNLFVGPVGTAALTFHGPVTASGNVFHSWRGTTTTAQQDGGTIGSSTAVNFSTDATVNGSPSSMRTSGGAWNDSTMGAQGTTTGVNSLTALVTAARSASFSQYASQTWKGNLQTASMGITPYNPMGFSEVVGNSGGTDIHATDLIADDGANVGTGAGYGHGYGPHSLIEPSMAAPATSDAYYTAKVSIEEAKFANRAGLYLKAVVDASDNLTSITIYGDPHSAPVGTPAANIGPNGGLKLGTVPANVFNYIKYTSTGSGSSTVVTQGLYDQHQAKPINLLQINMGNLKTALANMTTATAPVAGTDIVKQDGTKWGIGTANTGFDPYTPSSTGWNGGIYVDISTASTANQTAVLLANGVVASGSTLTPTGSSAPNAISGLTVATNSPVYILGHYNSDGTVTTAANNNSALYPDDSPGTAITASVQSPCAIAADAVTILSPNYFGTASGTRLAPSTNVTSSARSSYATAAPSASASTEVAAALITGTTTTSPTASGTQNFSGGVHNLPRFLENWGTNTVAIRGSLVSMFSSRIQTADWSISYYQPPVRRWGFDQTFANGKYPPICPQVISYRRVDFSYILNAAAYTAKVNAL